MNTAANTRQKILETAVRIVDTQGPRHLTLDAVAAEAGLSKGGVLYHYPSKRALIEGMLTLVMNSFDGAVDGVRAGASTSKLPLVGMIALAEKDEQPKTASLALAILAAASEDPSLLHEARTRIARQLKDISSDNSDGQLAQILYLAVEGLRFYDMLRLLPDSFERENIFSRLCKLAESLPRGSSATAAA